MPAYSSLAFNDEQLNALPGPPPLPHCVSIHGSYCIQNGNGSHREVATPERMAGNLAALYAEQIPDPSSYNGIVVIDYEPQNGVIMPGEPPQPIEAEELSALLVECVAHWRTVLRKARLCVWGHPSSYRLSANGPTEVEPEELDELWKVVDLVCFHDYTNSTHFKESQRELLASRIAAANYAGLPTMQCVWRKRAHADEWIPAEAFVQRLQQGRRLGCDDVLYWDSLKFNMPNAWETWEADAEWIDDLYSTPVPPPAPPVPPAPPSPGPVLIGREETTTTTVKKIWSME